MVAMTHDPSRITYSIPDQSISVVQSSVGDEIFHEKLRQHIEDLRTILQMYHDTLHSLHIVIHGVGFEAVAHKLPPLERKPVVIAMQALDQSHEAMTAQVGYAATNANLVFACATWREE